MDANQLRQLQAPLKERYKADPAAAQVTLKATGQLMPQDLACRITSERTSIVAGLHAMAGGDGTLACSAELLLESLVACAGVTLCAVSTALEIPLAGGRVIAEGDLDFRGTLGVERSVPVGFERIRLRFELESSASEEQLATLKKLTDRYCVVYQTLAAATEIETSVAAN